MHFDHFYFDAFVGGLLVRKETLSRGEVWVRRRYALILPKNTIVICYDAPTGMSQR